MYYTQRLGFNLLDVTSEKVEGCDAMSCVLVQLKSLRKTTIVLLVAASATWLTLPFNQKSEDVAKSEVDDVWEGELVPNPLQLEMTKQESVILESQAVQQKAAPKPMPEPKAPKPKPLREVDEVNEVVEVVEVSDPVPETMDGRVLCGSKAVDEKLLFKDLEDVIKSGKWTAYRNQLQLSVEATITQMPDNIRGDGLTELMKVPQFYGTVLRWKMLKMFPPILWKDAADNPSFDDFSRHIMTDNAAMEEVLITVQEEDDVLKVLPMMVNLWSVHDDKPDMAAKYFNLNLACAVVFDEPVAYVHGDSDGDDYESSGVDAHTRYDWYVTQNERGYLEVSIDRSSARDLTFVVCAPVTESELDWAVKEYRSLRRKSWGKTYGDIEYLMERAVDGLNPYETYTLEEILKEGGICGDQTHFCINTARAAGIPALGLSGMTNRGGHAWAAVKIEDEEWSTKIGRIEGVSEGKARDPQTGKSINEQDIWLWSSREYRRASRKLELQRQLWLSQIFGALNKTNYQRQVVEAVRRDGEPFPEYWKVLYETMQLNPEFTENPGDPVTLSAYKDFCDALKREFRENPRMSELARTVEEEHLFPHMDLSDVRRQIDRDRGRQHREAPEQSDLVTTSLKREADWIYSKITEGAAEGDESDKQKALAEALKEISQLYDRALREYGKSVSGFATMCEDYFTFIKDHEELAPKAVRDMELAFKRVVDTGSDDWFRAKTEVELHKRIAQMYRQVGEDKKADLMERRLETQMERARRKAL